MTGDLHDLSIEEAAELISGREISPVELTKAHLQRIEALNETLHAYITVTAELALAQARRAERELMSRQYRGPLHGIPIAYKDNIATAGIRTTCHSRLLLGWTPSYDATVVRKLSEAGCVCLGKLSLHEFAYGGPCANEAFEPAVNPWSRIHSPGASSSGAGAAVAAGMAMAAVGTDTGGSIRNPAAACGVVGMKPTFGLVSNRGVVPLSPAQDHTGPLTRTIGDNRLMLAAMTGFDSDDPHSVDVRWSLDEIAQPEELNGLVVGFPRQFIRSCSPSEEVMAAFTLALRELEALGAEIIEFDWQGVAEANAAAALILLTDAYRYHRENLERYPECFGSAFRERVLQATDHTATDYEEAGKVGRRFTEALDRFLEAKADVIVMPTSERSAQLMTEIHSNPLAARGPYTRMCNLTGTPALALPMGTSEGLPLSLQIMGRKFDEATIYRVAASYARTSNWIRSCTPSADWPGEG